MSSTLKQRVLRAGLWSLSGFASSLVFRFGSNLLMTRLLLPEMFGVMAMASTVMFGLAMFSDVGIKQNIVQSPHGKESSYLNTAWTIQIVRGLLLWFLAVLLSFTIKFAGAEGGLLPSSVYAAPDLPYIIAVLSISCVIQGFESTKLSEASRSLSIGYITRIEIASQVVGLISMIGWVRIDRSVWALVAGSISSSLARTLLSHYLLPGNSNRWEWHSAHVREIIHFGKWLFLSSILGFLVNSGDRLLLGGFVNSTLLGLYVIATLYVGAVEGILGKIMSDVSFPAFSEVVRERPATLKQNYYQFHRVIAGVAYLSSGVLITAGKSLINLLYDPRYQAAGWMLEATAAILLTVPFRLVTQSFMALGMPKLQSNVVFIRLIFLVVLTPIGFYGFGLAGALAAIVFSHFSYVPMIIWYNVRHKLFDLRAEALLLPLIPIGMMTGVLLSTAIGYLRK